MSVKTVAKTEKFSGTCEADVAANKVTVSCTVKRDKDAELRYVQHWTFDFAGCSQGEILGLAVRRIVVDQQNTIRNAKDFQDAVTQNDNKTFSVREYLDAERATQDAFTRTKSLMGKLTPEQIAALVAQYGAKS